MKRSVLCLVLLASVLVAAPAWSFTGSGRAGNDTWTVNDGSGGQLVITVYWKTKAALLYLAGTCSDGATFVSGSLQDRFQRVEIGIDPSTTCEISVIARSSRASKYYINIQGTGIFGASEPGLKVSKSTGPPSPELRALIDGAKRLKHLM